MPPGSKVRYGLGRVLLFHSLDADDAFAVDQVNIHGLVKGFLPGVGRIVAALTARKHTR